MSEVKAKIVMKGTVDCIMHSSAKKRLFGEHIANLILEKRQQKILVKMDKYDKEQLKHILQNLRKITKNAIRGE